MRALMCRPTYFDVPIRDLRLNPHMNPEIPPNRKRAMEQWLELRNLYRKLGVKVYCLRTHPALFDQVFTCNVAWGHEGTFVMANFAPRWREDEVPIAAQWLARNRFGVLYLPDMFPFEGQGDIISIGDAGKLFCFGQRNDPSVYVLLEKVFFFSGTMKPIIPLKLADPNFYHGDLAIRYSRHRNAILYAPQAFGRESLEIIEKLPIKKMEAPPALFKQITENGRKNFPMNGCYIDRVETFPWDSRFGDFPQSVRDWIEKDGGEVALLNYDEFGLSGAGHRCCTLFLD